MTDAIEFWAYPLRHGDRLPNFDWMPPYGEQLLSSRFVAKAIQGNRRQDIGTALLLWCAAMKQNPAGTLPDDDVELARLAGFGADLDGWIEARAGLALYGWRPTHVDDAPVGSIARLGHPVLSEIAEGQFRRKRGRERSREVAQIGMQKSRIRAKLREIKHARMADNAQAVEQIAEWLRENDLYITADNVRVAVEENMGAPRVVSMGGREV
ncbi:DUF1376 domain-containing protein [Paracoccus sediminilitoris]|uniref:DUF1376 domain-containing protein n=1 Tax=Paracoccus sediminilitoris TaxID=2202419 RepID=UPI00272B2EDF|nr:DUF1376 domain-containing protein [Paracoccus sediminilitoris]